MKQLLTCIFLFVFVAPRLEAASQPVVTDSTFVFPLQGQHAHGSSVVELPNGDYLLAWFQGSGERTADDVRIMGARLKKGDKKWSVPFELADTPGLPDCNPVLFMAEGKLFLVWIAVLANRWENSLLRVRSTTAFGGPAAPDWQWQDNILLKPDDRFVDEVAARLQELPEQHHGWSAYAPQYDELTTDAAKDPGKRSIGWMTRIKPLVSGNRILLPVYSDGFNFSMVAISEDGGRSWKPSLPIVGRGPIQPALAQRRDGTVIAYMRDSGDAPTRVQVSKSSDGGWSWTAAQKSDIPNGASVDVLVLDDGRWVMLGNDVDDGRYRISLYFSDDEGETWSVKMPLEYDESKKGRYSYPSLIQGSDGLLHISYSYHLGDQGKTIKYVTVKP